jgi:hypothetical protein
MKGSERRASYGNGNGGDDDASSDVHIDEVSRERQPPVKDPYPNEMTFVLLPFFSPSTILT